MESLIVIAIIATLTAFIFPVYAQSKKSAIETTCRSNLKQVWTALALYRSDWDGDGRFGFSYDMGLPPRTPWRGLTPPYPTAVLNSVPHMLLKVDRLKCGNFPSKFNNSNYCYNLRYQDPTDNPQNRWDKYVQESGDASILITDVNHSDPNAPMMSPYFKKYGFGLTLGGSLIKQRKPGDFDILRWWTTSCSDDCPL
jgi:type II secretory pathway pseudopilin PulG